MLLQSCAFCGRQQIHFGLPPKKEFLNTKSYLGDYLNKVSSGHVSVSVFHEWDEKVFSAHDPALRLISVSDVWRFGYHCFVLAAVLLEQHHPTLIECPQIEEHQRGRKMNIF